MVNIEDLIEVFGNMIDGIMYLYDKINAEIIEINVQYIDLAESYLDGESIEGLSDWEIATVYETVAVLENNEDYVFLPNKYEINDYRFMAKFSYTRAKKKHRIRLMDALGDRPSMLLFRRIIKELKLEQEWKTFKREEYLSIALDWCERNAIEIA